MSAKTYRLFIILLISAAPLLSPQGGKVMAMAPASPIKATEVTVTTITSDLQSDVPKGGDLKSPNNKPADNSSPLGGSRGGLLRGIYLSADMFGYIYPIFVKDKYYSTEISATVNLKNRFFPVIEAGFGHTDMVSQLYEIGYRASAPYYRIGMDYNMQYKNGKPNYIYLGARLGYTTFKYDVNAPSLHDPVWGDVVPMQLTDMPCQAIWAEAVAGVRAEIAKNFYMGWSLRYKYPLRKSPIANGGPWYIPGFGAGSGNIIGATYYITYYLNFTKRRP